MLFPKNLRKLLTFFCENLKRDIGGSVAKFIVFDWGIQWTPA
jgi:hypothetical protein